MTTSDNELIPLLTPAGFDDWSEQRNQSPKNSDDLLSAAALGGRFVGETAGFVGAEQRSEDRRVVTARYRGRFHYRWIAVDFGGASSAQRASLTEAMRRTKPFRGGLLLSNKSYDDLPEHVHTVATSTTDAPWMSEAWYLLQYARFVLRTLSPTRVLFLDLGDAALLADSLGEHSVAIVCTPASVASTMLPAQTRRTAKSQGEIALGWLRHAGAHTPLTDFHTLAPLASTAASEALRVARALLLVEASDLPEIRRRAPNAALLTSSTAACASHLVPEASDLGAVASTASSGELRVVIHDLTRRDRERAPVRAGFACLHLLGDALAATPVVRAYRQRHPEAHITLMLPDTGYARVMELCTDVDRLMYVPVDHQQIVYGGSTEFVQGLPCFEEGFDERFVLDIQAVARNVGGKGLHMSEGYAQLAGFELTSRRPSIDRERALSHCPDLGLNRRYAVLVRHTVSGHHVGPREEHTKRWADSNWIALARQLTRELGLQVVSIGTAGERRLETEGVLDVHCLSIVQVAGLLANASLMIAVDNGIYHLGQALRTPTVHLYPSWFDPNWVASDPEGPHVDLVADLRQLSVRRVLDTASELVHRTGRNSADRTAVDGVAANRARS